VNGHVTVNGRVVIVSYQCRPGETIAVRDREASRKMVETNLQYPGLANLPSHLSLDKNKMVGKVNSVIEREWVALQIKQRSWLNTTHAKPKLVVICHWSFVICD